jgi:hypothetical protein
MTTAVDSNVIVALWDRDPGLSTAAQSALDAALAGKSAPLDVTRWAVVAPMACLDLGCVAAHGMFHCDANGCHTITPQGKPAKAFLFELIARLQSSATVPMIDIRAYALAS